ncbi:MAG: A/G-specific adenine glycosylase, partial [Gemmatimonadetes bacterium]|nr:A/G-specific adenine glycosylase [Gemmatimonadota bacterium]
WYDRARRDLPWRRTSDPYRVWVSEVMLQQTRVETVIPYYERWLERFPTVSALATADLDDVLPLWKGLGYYSRARNLHRAAQAVLERHGGEVPAEPDALRALPGVGAYTAGAVASIAFGRPEPLVDGNVRRVLSRWYDLEAPGDREVWALARDLVDPERPGDFNQAL